MSIDLKLFRFQSDCSKEKKQLPQSILGYRLIRYKPRLWSLSAYQQNPLLIVFWLVASIGKFEILLLTDGNTIVHSSYVTPKVFRFPFMRKNDIQIGPCATNPLYQRKGIYTQILTLILDVYGSENRSFWIYTNMTNFASQKAIIKSGFEFHTIVKMSKATKILRIKK